MNCKDFRELIDSYLSDELLTETNHEVLSHLENCVNCRKVIEARREVRQHLKSAVLNAPQYQIGKNFSHNLRTQLQHEALKNKSEKANSWFGIKTWLSVAVGLLLVFTVGFWFLYNSNNSQVVNKNEYQTDKLPAEHLVNIAFGDHEHCAINQGTVEPIEHADTPARFANAEEIAMPQLKNVLANAELKMKHTCEYRNTEFTHLVVEKDEQILSIMMTEKSDAENFGENIAHFSTPKYQMDRFDVDNTAVFIVSGFDKKTNSNIATSLHQPFRKYLSGQNSFQTALLLYY